MLRLSSNLQGSRPFDFRRCANNKVNHFIGKKISFGSKKRRKNGFFGVFRQDSRLSFRKSAVLLRLKSNLQGSQPFGCKRCANNIIDHFKGKKFSFGPKNFEKTGFLVFSDKTPGYRFANLLYCSD